MPEDYWPFITEIGNGCAGPWYGVLPFGKDDDDRERASSGLVGDLSTGWITLGSPRFWTSLERPLRSPTGT
jgi:hypothetical protein